MELFSKLGTVMATIYFVGSIARDYLPSEFYSYLTRRLHKLAGFFSSYITVVIDENEGGFKVSDTYEAVQIYLSTRSSSSADRLRLNKLKNAKEFTFTMDKNQQLEEEFEGIKLWWVFHSRELKQQVLSWRSISDEKRSFELKFHKRDKTKVFDAYLPHVVAEAKLLELKNRHRKIYTNKGDNRSYESRKTIWTPVVFDHPATFKTLALDPEMKDDIVRDLNKFSQRENYYRKVGRAWKRGYLLYGPPGTGKSSMIAAMANYLEYDIYDLELTEVKSNTELRKLLIATTNKSIIVIEDIDCSLDLSDRKKKPKKDKTEEKTPGGTSPEEAESEESKVTLSGVLNFTDGLWSCCGSERIIIFTTNHVERLDPALLRSGRMDKHIHLSFCGFSAFKVLARNYLGLEDHPLFKEVENLVKDAQITPADVGEEMMRASDDPSSALEKVIEALKRAKEKAAAAKNEVPKENVKEEASSTTEESSMTSAIPISDLKEEKAPEVSGV